MANRENKQKPKDFETLVKYNADDIVQSWIDYFVFHKQVTSKRITTRIK